MRGDRVALLKALTALPTPPCGLAPSPFPTIAPVTCMEPYYKVASTVMYINHRFENCGAVRQSKYVYLLTSNASLSQQKQNKPEIFVYFLNS